MAVIDVVKFNGGQSVFAWKYPSEELGTWTQLIVNESQEAVLFKGGQALDIFGPGRHTLETANIPFLNNLINLPFGGRSPFAAEVWYINKTYSLDIKWGTPTPIQLQDPKYKVFVPVRSHGQFGIQISDSKKFLVKLVGTVPVFDKENIVKYFRGLYLTKVKDSISSYLIKNGVSALEINAYLDELSEYLKEKITPTFDSYGIKLLNFYVNDINVPEEDPAIRKLKAALAKRAEMDIVGYSYVQERSFNTLDGAATNTSSGAAGLMGAGIGLGMGAGIGNAVGGQFGDMVQVLNLKDRKKCPKCSIEMEATARFCAVCGFDTQKSDEAPKEEAPKADGEPVENSNKSAIAVCSECEHEYSRKSKFCPECGSRYNPCPSCGADLKKNADSCHICGKPVSSSKPCPKCGTAIENEKTKFCPECGESLIKACSSCGTKYEGSPKFCPECGNPLQINAK